MYLVVTLFWTISHRKQWDVNYHPCKKPGVVCEIEETNAPYHDDAIKWKHFLRYWPFVRGIHRSPVNSSHKGQWRGALMFSLICVWINDWVNNREAGDLRRHRGHYDVTVMLMISIMEGWITYNVQVTTTLPQLTASYWTVCCISMA